MLFPHCDRELNPTVGPMFVTDLIGSHGHLLTNLFGEREQCHVLIPISNRPLACCYLAAPSDLSCTISGLVHGHCCVRVRSADYSIAFETWGARASASAVQPD